jgi:hypothetical protein
MAQYLSPSNAQDLLVWIHEGVPVFDCDDNKVGKVKHVHLSAVSGDFPVAKPENLYRLPPETQAYLVHRGYVEIDCGFLARNRLVTPEQIDQLNDQGLKLKVSSDSLIEI